ncbi:MAG: hypothetical protein ACLP7O_09730 [Terracidiphilus sp.]
MKPLQMFPHRAVFVLMLVSWLPPAQNVRASAQAASKTTEQLIDDLITIDGQSIGINSSAVYDGFLAEDAKGHFRMGVLGIETPAAAPQVRELVRRGPVALPELLRHLDDPRPTKLVVGNDPQAKTRQVGLNEFMWEMFSDEYDPRTRPEISKGLPRRWPKTHEIPFEGGYQVRVGDVCFVIIGQIVNRNLYAVRYQPSGGLIVNSPIHTPVLAEEARRDWGEVGPETLQSSLIGEIAMAHTPHSSDWDYFVRARAFGALTRLRYYFPETYKALSGENLKTRRDFEAHQGDPFN